MKVKLGLDKLVINEIDNNQAIHILRQNYAISINLDITIDKSLKNILTKLKVFDYEYTGGLYTCFNCEEGQLNDNQIKEIVKIAKEDLQNNLINTDKETQYYFIYVVNVSLRYRNDILINMNGVYFNQNYW